MRDAAMRGATRCASEVVFGLLTVASRLGWGFAIIVTASHTPENIRTLSSGAGARHDKHHQRHQSRRERLRRASRRTSRDTILRDGHIRVW
eukprot:225034-Lingulodinium_polyedra.AAC.1